ncbi:unnamed protein product, partial [Staurois parvus]
FFCLVFSGTGSHIFLGYTANLLSVTKPRTLHSLYLDSHRFCIHYIWSPTVHRTWTCNYFSKYKLLNTFFSSAGLRSLLTSISVQPSTASSL